MIYTIKSGDTLYKIANNYGVTVNDIVVANGLKNPDSLAIGQSIIIPSRRENTYIVKAGDTMYKIALRFGVQLDSLITANPQVSNPNLIEIGDVLYIPDNRRSIEVNGYAIANISSEVLEKTLPSLTYLSIFSYQAKADGSLYILYEDVVISSALRQSVAPIMVVTNISTAGGFDSNIAHSILTDASVQNNLISAIMSTVTAKRYRGINIDFEYIYPEDREAYSNFLKNLKEAMNRVDNTLILLVAVAPKYRDTQSGLLYEAHDYRTIGEIADRVIIMTYEWGYMYGEPMAVSPKNEMASVLKYAVTRIPSNKILMGLPNYAYDWTLPFVSGNSARALTNSSALTLALETGSNIQFDSKSQTPYFEYTDSTGNKHVVWFDDARSYSSKLDLVRQFNLAGISVWTINNYFAPLWSVVNEEFTTVKVI